MKIFGFNFGRSQPQGLPPLPQDVVQNVAAMLQRQGVRPQISGDLRDIHRGVQDMNEKMFRAYDGAITTAYNTGFRSTYGSSDAEIMSSLYTVRGRCRTIGKDTPHGKNIIRTLENNVIGHRGFKLKMRLKDKSGKPDKTLNKEIEDIYRLAGRPENFTVRGNMSRVDAFCIMEVSAFRDGFIMLRHHRGFPHNDFGYAEELLEGDRLQESYMGRADGSGNQIRFSVELDEYFRPVAYWVLTRHPGDPFGTSDPRNSNTWRERILAKDITLYNNRMQRAEQTIGFPEMDNVIQHMFRDNQYETAMTLAAIASCCKPYWIKKTIPTGMNFTAEEYGQWVNQISAAYVAGPQGTNGNGPTSGIVARQEGISPRSTTEVPAGTREFNFGEELMQTDPKFPIEAASDFKRDNGHAVAAGVGMSFQEVTGMFDNLGFSAARLSRLPSQANYMMRQVHFIDMIVRPNFKETIRAAIMVGKCSAPMSQLEDIVESAHWTGVRWPDTNPLQDVQARILQSEAKEISPQQVQDDLEGGKDLDDLYEEMEEAQELQQEHNLIPDEEADVTRPTVSKGEPGQTVPAADANGNAQPPAKTKTHNPVRRRGIRPGVLDLLALQGDGRNGYKD